MSQWSTDKQRKAAVTAMRVLANVEKLPAEKLTSALSNPEKGVYKRSSDAKQVIKELVSNENFPVQRKGKYVERTDIQPQVTN